MIAGRGAHGVCRIAVIVFKYLVMFCMYWHTARRVVSISSWVVVVRLLRFISVLLRYDRHYSVDNLLEGNENMIDRRV